ncbi:Sugar phosphate permease [Actinopolyspora lacussalsi subsp. righensis]|uniref:Sugar phosphate permease n=1 Tax=Actinopolyspora righensis TaxID=995060 RepID=A0A1I7C458_9ACTN|nr:MFS transporter [Actinopolyspora righensis]SFT94213.1 Sugar phosphate permease [Actinopolyspora righensis]
MRVTIDPSESSVTEPVPTATSRRAWLVWSVAAACYFVALFHRASLAVAADAALDRFSAGPAALSVLSALQLGIYLALQIPAGVLADRIGPRRLITGATLALAVGSAVFAVSASLVGGLAGRALIGLGDAFLFTNVLRLAAQWFPAERFGRIAALTGLVGGVGQLAATAPLATSLRVLGWLGTFLGAAGLTAVLAVSAWEMVRDRPRVVGSGDAVGRPSSAREVEPVRAALRAVVTTPGTWHSFWVHFVMMGQFVAVTVLWGPPWLMRAQGYGAAAAGNWVLLCVAGFLVGAWACGQFVAGRPARRERFVLVLSLLLAVVWLTVIGWPGVLPVALLAVLLVLIGIGGGAAMLAFDGARTVNAAHRSGLAVGTANMGGFTAAVLIQLAVGGVLRVAEGLAAGPSYRLAYVPVLLVIVVGALGQLRQSRRARGFDRG